MRQNNGNRLQFDILYENMKTDIINIHTYIQIHIYTNTHIHMIMHKEVIISCILTRQTTHKIFTNLYSEVSKINVDTNSERRGGGCYEGDQIFTAHNNRVATHTRYQNSQTFPWLISIFPYQSNIENLRHVHISMIIYLNNHYVHDCICFE